MPYYGAFNNDRHAKKNLILEKNRLASRKKQSQITDIQTIN